MKRDLVKYLRTLSKEQLEDQILDLYNNFKNVKTYYNFAFSPKEDELLEEFKIKVKREYYPERGKKVKKRRSVAQKYIKNFKLWGVQPDVLVEAMIYNLETSVSYYSEHPTTQIAVYNSIQKSFTELMKYVWSNGLYSNFKDRIEQILSIVRNEEWPNWIKFERDWNDYRK